MHAMKMVHVGKNMEEEMVHMHLKLQQRYTIMYNSRTTKRSFKLCFIALRKKGGLHIQA